MFGLMYIVVQWWIEYRDLYILYFVQIFDWSSSCSLFLIGSVDSRCRVML